MPAATTSTTLGPALPDETMPSVNTEDPEMPSAVAKSTPRRTTDQPDAQDDQAEPDDEQKHHGGGTHERESRGPAAL